MSDIPPIEERAREARLAYYKSWRKKKPDKVKEHNKNYWAKFALKQEQEIALSTQEAADKNDAENQ